MRRNTAYLWLSEFLLSFCCTIGFHLLCLIFVIIVPPWYFLSIFVLFCFIVSANLLFSRNSVDVSLCFLFFPFCFCLSACLDLSENPRFSIRFFFSFFVLASSVFIFSNCFGSFPLSIFLRFPVPRLRLLFSL